MNVTLARRWAAVVAVAAVAGGCASGTWRWADDAVVFANDSSLALPVHRAVERVTLRIRGHELEFVGYRTCNPQTRDVRAQLLLDSGISALDVAVHDAENQRISGSVFEGIPNFAATAMEDLRRTWGSRSVFAIVSTGRFSRCGVVTDGVTTYLADRLQDGSWLAVEPGAARLTGALHVTLLTHDLVPEATIAYSDCDDDGIPREIHLVDLRDAHTLDVEVEEAHLVTHAAEPAK